MALIGQIGRFGVVGILATATHLVTGLTLNRGFDAAPFWANLVAFSCALGVSFLGQTRLAFPGSEAGRGAFARFSLVALAGLGLNQTIVWLVTSVFAAPYELALAIIIATVPAATFALLKFWALRR